MFKFKSDSSEFKNAIDGYVNDLDLKKELENMNLLPSCDIPNKKYSQKKNLTSKSSDHDN